MTSPDKRNPPGPAGVAEAKTGRDWRRSDDSAIKLPHNWRERLPSPALYYSMVIRRLGESNAVGWARGQCPFHDDAGTSLSVQLGEARGGWRCDAGCGGGDLIGFHQRLIGQSFKVAVRDLLGVRT